MNSKKVEEFACVAAIPMMVIIFLQMGFHKFAIFCLKSILFYNLRVFAFSENVFDDVETKTYKSQSNIATHINNTPQVCAKISCFLCLNLDFAKRF